ncbi:TetR/AcrR family transcriptional regulator [Pseudonocardia humida]|uniref:TetR/AcrR family transcriptional regulator n=1 Tax=Pseudonocardia humida TaxID=2800819 RepID=UPI00207D00F1|nr:TetR/AcrR family transcriptional regulator [Pseudonocardia humida]
MPPTPSEQRPSLRERKRARTRQALVEAAADLFTRNGYDATTVADIAAAADIGTRTFFSHFTSKEEVLFPEVDQRVGAAIEAIAARGPADGPVDVLARALRHPAVAASDDLVGPLATLRLQLIRTVPAVRGRALQLQQDAQREIARHLHAAYPEELDEVGAAALVGAFVGAVGGALDALLDGGEPALAPDDVRERLSRAITVALTPWLHRPGS